MKSLNITVPTTNIAGRKGDSLSLHSCASSEEKNVKKESPWFKHMRLWRYPWDTIVLKNEVIARQKHKYEVTGDDWNSTLTIKNLSSDTAGLYTYYYHRWFDCYVYVLMQGEI